MILRVGIENNNDNRTIAWALEHPGCFAYGENSEAAQRNIQQTARGYAGWVHQHGMSWMPDEPVEVNVDETFDAYVLHTDLDLEPGQTADTLIESFFRYDMEPLTGTDVQRAFKLLDWSRQDLLALVKGLSDERLNQTYDGERWSIDGILKHIGAAEWWYQERIGFPFPEYEEDLPAEGLGCLELVRAHFVGLLPKLEAVHHIVDEEGELWSPRKVLRRALWHERDHTDHIRKLL